MRSSLLALGLLLLAGGWLSPSTLAAGDSKSLVLEDGTDIPIQVHTHENGPVLLWFPSEHGVLDGHHSQARRLQAMGVEVWLPDPFLGHFLPNAPSSFDRFPTALPGNLIQVASRDGQRPVFVFGNDRAAPWLLEGLREWQLQHPEAGHLAGLILMSPYLHVGLPEVGETLEFHPISRLTNLPIYLIQPMLSPQYPLLQQVRAELERGGSDVAVRILPEVRDRFFFRPSTLEAEEAARLRFPTEVLRAIRLLAHVPAGRTAAPVAEGALRLATPTRQDRRLEPVAERPPAPPLQLPALDDGLQDLADHRGEVVLINFWASWCPPCVHEMPSMQQLENRLRDRGFRILAVNLGESEATIRSFLERVGTDFTILLDPASTSLNDWRALAYPTSYLVDRQGRLRYSLYGAIEWNDAEVVAQVAALLDE